MKTAFQVTITQSGDRVKMGPTALERELRTVARTHFKEDGTTVTVRHLVENPPEEPPAADTLEALVREYGNTPTLGTGRVRADVMADIRALMADQTVAAATSVDVQTAVGTLNKTIAESPAHMVPVNRKDLAVVVRDAHRAGQGVGRLYGKDSYVRAEEYAEGALAQLGVAVGAQR